MYYRRALSENKLGGTLPTNPPFTVTGDCKIDDNNWNCPLPDWCRFSSEQHMCFCGACIPSVTPSTSFTSSISHSPTSTTSLIITDSPSPTPSATSSMTRTPSKTISHSNTPSATEFPNFDTTYTLYYVNESVLQDDGIDEIPKWSYAVAVILIIFVVVLALMVIIFVVRRVQIHASDEEKESLLEGE